MGEGTPRIMAGKRSREVSGASGAEPAGDVVAAVEQRLAGLQERPVHEHAEAYDEVHRLLEDALTRVAED